MEAAGALPYLRHLHCGDQRVAVEQIFAEDGDEVFGIRRLIFPDRTAGHFHEKVVAAVTHHDVPDGSDVAFYAADSCRELGCYGDVDFFVNTLEPRRVLKGQLHRADKISVPAIVAEDSGGIQQNLDFLFHM